MPFHKLHIRSVTIYYFSGTGNSENVARWMALKAADLGIECEIFNIASIDRKHINPAPSDSLIVFVSPVHGFNYPPVMLYFIARFPKGRNKVILMDTRAGMLIGNYNLPGISGAAFLFSSIILKFKGYSIGGTKSVDLPSNWLSLHPGLNTRTVRILHQKQKASVIDFAEEVLQGKEKYVSLFESLIDVIISPIAIAYYFVGRFVFAKTFYASGDCNSCDACIQNCPVKAIVKVDHRPFWTFRCESCMRCMSHCPKNCIQTAHGFIIAFWFLSSVVTGLFFYYFNNLFFNISNLLLRNIIETLIFLLLLSVSHRIVHFLMRFKFVENIMVYTSLTKYKFWGRRYKALKNF